MDNQCPYCGEIGIETSIEKEKFQYGLNPVNQIEVDVPVRKCNHCKQQFLDCEAEEIKDKAVADFLKSGNYICTL